MSNKHITKMDDTRAYQSKPPIGISYNDPTGLSGSPVQSSAGRQVKEIFSLKKVLITNAKNRYFTALGKNIPLPKNNGTRIRQSVSYPILDSRNINDQGIDARGVRIENGNLWGSSRDIGLITKLTPILTEEGGAVNRVGISRGVAEGTINKFGISMTYTQDAIDLDSNDQLVSESIQELMTTAHNVNEAYVQKELLNSAGVVVYAGNSYNDESMDHTSILSTQTFRRLGSALDNTKTPKNTKYITGSDKIDTRTASVHRTILAGSETVALIRKLKDDFGNPAFIPREQYGASNATILENEVGIIEGFRIVQVPDMLYWEGRGAEADSSYGLATGNREGKDRYNIYPLLCIGADAFDNLTLEGSGMSGDKAKPSDKFIFAHNPPGTLTTSDHFGVVGVISIQWWTGLLIRHPERIGLIKTVAIA